MRRAIAAAAEARLVASPNPWVGAVVVDKDDRVVGIGATSAPGGDHAEIEAIASAGALCRGSTLYSTLEPCCHRGRTGPCTDAISKVGIAQVVYGIDDPDPRVAGRGAERLREMGVAVTSGVLHSEIEAQLAAYVCHRRTGRPFVILKLAATLDGHIALADGSSSWITGDAARADVHRLRAESDAILVGAGTVRADDPRLTARDFAPSDSTIDGPFDPRRYVLGSAIPDAAMVAPATIVGGPLTEVLDQMGADGVLQLLVEGGAEVAAQFARADLVDRFIIYYAPALAVGDDAVSMFAGSAVESMAELVRGRFDTVTRIGEDIRVEVVPVSRGANL
ncbi:MAG: bifunctional diaminohydroxyphosphoribosylaminopyrimidine deaminase/5-amino-6-(5-phosphoribosylamino)uracil reductase RibD [Acidobacteria bacterium]|nr:bifunctional diaminohydroxyphosphoribosylaminopyrimidine deaminase/5-amino-6-(5-phosphoribosylamino)uracil reductase RibD [Acidobacteriota bacterium]